MKTKAGTLYVDQETYIVEVWSQHKQAFLTEKTTDAGTAANLLELSAKELMGKEAD